MVDKAIVTTSIYSPSKALLKFAKMKDWVVVVIGDLKTPHKEYDDIDNVIYLSPDEQKQRYPLLSEAIGWNCIMRRNIGFIEAYRMGAKVVATIDDDNIPYDNWGKDILVGKEVEMDCWDTDLICFDPLYATNHKELWHRGFPIQLLALRNGTKSVKKITVDVQAGFWDGDPDIDAICRFEHDPNCSFDCNCFPFTTNTFSPFNSQNTFLSRDILKNYFVMPHVGRMDDIWASYYVEAKGYNVAYSEATVRQDRNAQDITANMEKEYIGYSNNLKLLEDLKGNPDNFYKYIPKRTQKAFNLYKRYFKEI